MKEDKSLSAVFHHQTVQTVVHDLRTPMTVIKGNLLMLLSGMMGQMSQEQQLLLKRSVGPLEDMILMTENLLQAAQLDMDDIHLELAEADLDHLLAETIDFYQFPFKQRGMEIGRLGNTIGLRLTIDAFWIKRVLHNLIWNAFKFTPDNGRVMLRVGREPSGALSVSIEDTGRGIPEHKLATIFDKFSQAERSDRKIGTGLGLWICRRVMELHGGAIRAESIPGEGSRFVLTFPPHCVLP